MLRNFFKIISLIFLVNGICYANDSAGTTAAGGVTFSKTPEVLLLREDLKISQDQVDVHYLFKNNSTQPVTRQIIFPIPPYKPLNANAIWDAEIDPQLNTRQGIPFVNFSVEVNGKAVPFTTITRAVLANGQDITQQLQKAGLPLNPLLVDGVMPMSDLEEKRQQQWQAKAKQLNLIDQQGKALWQKQVYYIWEQTFPPLQTIDIKHHYRPSAGMFFSAALPVKPVNELLEQDKKAIYEKFGLHLHAMLNVQVFTQWLKQQIIKALAPPAKQRCDNCDVKFYANFYNVDYILKTGANWGGPIQEFNLTLVQPKEGSVAYNRFYDKMSAHIQQEKGQYHIQLKNFTPTEDLKVLFAAPYQPI